MLHMVIIMMSLIMLILANLSANILTGALALISFWIIFFVWGIKKWKEYVLICLFLISFFLFLVGSYLDFFTGNYKTSFNNGIELFIINMLYLSLAFIWLGCVLNKYLKIAISGNGMNLQILKSESSRFLFRKPAIIMFWITYPFYMIEILDRVNFVRQYGYLEYYKTYQYSSVIIRYGSIACLFFFFLFLACFPPKKQTFLPFAAYLTANILSVFSGKRTDMVVAMMFVIFYFLYRERIGDRERWFKKSYIKMIIIGAPLLMAFLGYWAYYRSDTVRPDKTILDYLFYFISSNGGSKEIIGYAYEFKDTLRSLGSHSYTFGFLIRTFSESNLAQMSVEMANSGTSLGTSITYIKDAYIYNMGGGFGTCYIAELWTDFGILGIVIYNLILGLTLAKIGNLKKDDTLQLVLAFYVVKKLFILPRNEALCMITDFFSKLLLLLFIGCTLIVYGKRNHSRTRRTSRIYSCE